MSKYSPKSIEKKWQKRWAESKIFSAKEDPAKKKFYALIEFPYPSGEGLHVGHPRPFTAMDVVARKKRMEGYNVLYPIGFDAFGLPTENYAIKTKQQPAAVTAKNIANFTRQLKSLGYSFDWDRAINTTDPKYYKWTQWIFLQLFKHGLAYKKNMPINWCMDCKIGLANEEVVNGSCERCGGAVEKRDKEQWMLAITKYADKLLAGLKDVDYIPQAKTQQENWIGRSEGALVKFLVPKYKEIFLASGNASKKARVEKLLKSRGMNVKIHNCRDLGIEEIKAAEDGDLPANSMAKALAYAGRVKMPILANDAGFFIAGEKIDPIKVKRNALAGADEKGLPQAEVGERMFNYYKKLTSERGGEAEAYWLDAWTLVLPDGGELAAQSRRDVVLTDKGVGKVDPYFPIRSLYRVKATGKYVAEQSGEDELKEMAPVTNALCGLLCEELEVFTTRPDTLFGATYVVVAPEHNFVASLLKLKTQNSKLKNIEEVRKYIKNTKKKSEIERADLTKEKTGVELRGIKAVNPVNNEAIPIFVADYVMIGYGTGAIMAVPAHDERDFDFAKKYNLPIKQVVAPLFSVPTGPDRVRSDKKTVHRRTAYILLKHWSEDKYLCLNWEKFGWHSGIIGGIEDGEGPIEAGRREIMEETGYKNIRFIKFTCGEIHNHFFAGHKDENRYAYGTQMLFQLENNEQTSTVREETKNHVTVWIEAENLEQWLNMPNFIYAWRVLRGEEGECFSGDGIAINSGFLDELPTFEAKNKIIQWLEEKNLGERKVQYKLRDWVFSRQRYWGEPIPLVRCEKCGWVPIPEKDLPLELPKVKEYEPTDTGESPLAKITKWVNTKCPRCGGPAKRETDVMPNWAGSSWYFLRYCDPRNDKELAAPDKLKYWMPVDWYNGGMEHTTLHLLYSRFWNQFLYDIGATPFSEPYKKRTSHGMILGPDGEKMSKSRGNVINPDEMVERFGADAFRMYIMFMGPFDQAVAWDTNGLVGVRRFLEKVWGLGVIASEAKQSLVFQSRRNPVKQGIASSLPVVAPRNDSKLTTLLHQTIRKVTEDIENMRFNTAIAKMMTLINEMSREESISNIQYPIFLKLLAPFAPHIAEELWEKFGHKNSIFAEPWPKYDPALAKDKEITLAVQVNGKLRDTLVVSADIAEDEAKEAALSSQKVQKWLAGAKPKKVIYVKGRLVSIVV